MGVTEIQNQKTYGWDDYLEIPSHLLVHFPDIDPFAISDEDLILQIESLPNFQNTAVGIKKPEILFSIRSILIALMNNEDDVSSSTMAWC